MMGMGTKRSMHASRGENTKAALALAWKQCLVAVITLIRMKIPALKQQWKQPMREYWLL